MENVSAEFTLLIISTMQITIEKKVIYLSDLENFQFFCWCHCILIPSDNKEIFLDRSCKMPELSYLICYNCIWSSFNKTEFPLIGHTVEYVMASLQHSADFEYITT